MRNLGNMLPAKTTPSLEDSDMRSHRPNTTTTGREVNEPWPCQSGCGEVEAAQP